MNRAQLSPDMSMSANYIGPLPHRRLWPRAENHPDPSARGKHIGSGVIARPGGGRELADLCKRLDERRLRVGRGAHSITEWIGIDSDIAYWKPG